jgi:hypothetical protein
MSTPPSTLTWTLSPTIRVKVEVNDGVKVYVAVNVNDLASTSNVQVND